VALLPPIPDRPADRPETWAEYLSRRAIVAMHRQVFDEFAAWLTKERLDPQQVKVFDPFRYFIDMVKLLPAKRYPKPTLFSADVTWREDAVRRLLADPSATDLIFTDKGVLQVTDLDIDLAPELKELFGTTTRRDGQ
jgi:hypothetical protein